MGRLGFLALCAMALGQVAFAQANPTVLNASQKINLGMQQRPVPADSSAFVINKDNIQIDFAGTEIWGTTPAADPDQRQGIAVKVTGNNVTIRNLKAHGYKFGVMALGAKNLTIENSDFSFGFKPRLFSTPHREDLKDWMSFHSNEKGEWERFGAGVYLDNCDGARIVNNTVRNGQCGLMISNTDRAIVARNDFSFLSAIGLGMYRSSSNQVLQNSIDWCVRGYSHGVYNRGQDSAAILMYEQCSNNVVAYNSATHSGDGLFLWAGQSTMDTGKGGCNDNLFYGNDFSHAPTNAIEATFSRNKFVNNLALDSWHGLWAGYSYESLVLGNIFGYCGEGIAWEHGQSNRIAGNLFYRSPVGVYLWMKEKEDPNWGYPKFRETASRGYELESNGFFDIGKEFAATGGAMILYQTSDLRVGVNQFRSVQPLYDIKGPAESVRVGPTVLTSETDDQMTSLSIPAFEMPKLGTGWGPGQQGQVFHSGQGSIAPQSIDRRGSALQGSPAPTWYVPWDPFGKTRFRIQDYKSSLGYEFIQLNWDEIAALAPKPFDGSGFPTSNVQTRRGREHILVDDWGPYDFKRPFIRPSASYYSGNQKQEVDFQILGPAGKYRVVESNGLVLQKKTGAVPGRLSANWLETVDPLRRLVLEYVGVATTSDRGENANARTPVRFEWSEFHLPIQWSVRWWNFDATTQDPRNQPEAFEKLLQQKATASTVSNELAYDWWRSPAEGVSTDYFATVALGEFSIAKGSYQLEVTADDGVKVWLNGRLVIDEWHYSAPQTYRVMVDLLGGKNRIEIKHFELDGFSTLRAKVLPN